MTEEEEEEDETLIYDTILMRDTCGNSRSKIKNYFYHKVYNSQNFKYVSNYEELILLDVLEGSKTKKEYIKTLIPFIILMCIGGISWILWIFICYCYKKPKGCLKRYSQANKKTRDICFFTFFGFCSIILILIITTIVYLNYAKNDINGAVCTLSMLRYEIVYGQSLLEKKSFKKPFWYGINTLPDEIEKIRTLMTTLSDNCENEILPILEKSGGVNSLDIAGQELKDNLENLYVNYKDEVITGAHPDNANYKTIPLYISNLGFKENNETYTGKVLQDYEEHYEYIIKKITDPLIDICEDLKDDNGNLVSALESFNDVVSTLEDSMNLVATYVTKKISDKLINLNNIFYVFYLIFLGLMIISIASISALFFIYYYKPISAMNYSIKIILYIINCLMIFCIILTGMSGILYSYFSDSSDIVDCMYSSKNIGSDDPRIIPRTTSSSVLTRCIRGDGFLLNEYLNDEGKENILSLKKINTIYLKIIEAYKRITSTEKNEYNNLISLEQLIEDFEFMKNEFSITTNKEENGAGDISYMLNELNKYTFAGMGYQTICETSTFHLWSSRPDSSPTVQICLDTDNEELELNIDDYKIEYKSIIGTTLSGNEYDNACSLDTETNPKYESAKIGSKKYYDALRKYYLDSETILNKILDYNEPNELGLKQIKSNFDYDFINELKGIITSIKNNIADPFWEVFGTLVNDTTPYSGVEDADKVDILGWLNCSFLGQDYNISMNTFKETLVPDLKVVTYCSLVFEILIIALYFIIISLANNIRDKDLEKNENGYDVESLKEDGGEIFEIVENNKYKKNYEQTGELITINKIKSKPKKSKWINTTESGFNFKTEKTNDLSKDEDVDSVKKNLPENIIQVPKFDIAENIEAIKNVDVRKLIDKDGKAVMHPIRISINSPLGVMEASDKYAHLYNYDVFKPMEEVEEDDESDIENGSYYQKNEKSEKKSKKSKKSKATSKKTKGKGKGKGKKKGTENGKSNGNDKESKQSSSFSF